MTARDFPNNTCPASRHVEMMAECLEKHGRYGMIHDEPKHCAESMRSVVESLYEARTAINTLAADLGCRTDLTKGWPDLEEMRDAVRRLRAGEINR